MAFTTAVTPDPDGLVTAYQDDFVRVYASNGGTDAAALLLQLGKAPFATRVRCDDPRLLNLVGCIADHATRDHQTVQETANRLLSTLENGPNGQLDDDAHHWAASIIAWAAATSNLPLEGQGWLLVDACGRRTAKRPLQVAWVSGLVSRLGLAGQAPKTLAEIGKSIGVTRERTRQMEARVLPLILEHPLWLPALDRAKALAGSQVRQAAEFLEELAAAGITARTADLAGLQAAAGVVGFAWAIEHSHGLLGLDEAEYRRVAAALKQPLGTPGIGTVEEVLEDINAVAGRELVTEQALHLVADTLPELVWTDPDRRWYLSGPANPNRVRMRNVARKMLSVHSPLAVATIVEGLRRLSGYRGDRVRVSTAQARAFFAAHVEFAVDGDLVTCVDALDYRKELGASAATMVEVLRDCPEEVESRERLLQKCVAAGMNKNTASLWLTFNEVIVDHGWSLWGLVGSRPSPGRVNALQESVREKFEMSEFSDGWDAQGHYQISFRATRSFLRSGTLSRNWYGPLRRKERFEVLTDDGDVVGTLRFSLDHSFSWGWVTPCAATEVRHGHLVTVIFDLNRQTARLTCA